MMFKGASLLISHLGTGGNKAVKNPISIAIGMSEWELLFSSLFRLASSVQVMMIIAVFLSYALQMYVPLEILWPWLKKRVPANKERLYDYSFRIGLVILTCEFSPLLLTWIFYSVFSLNCNFHFLLVFLGALVPNIGLFISLVGAVSSSFLALIFPPVIQTLTLWPLGLGPYKWILWKNIFIIMFGFIGFVTGTYTSLEAIVKYYASPKWYSPFMISTILFTCICDVPSPKLTIVVPIESRIRLQNYLNII